MTRTNEQKPRFYEKYTDAKAKECMADAIHYYNRARILEGIIARNTLGTEERATLKLLLEESKEKAEEEHRTANKLEDWYHNPVMRTFMQGHQRLNKVLDEAYQRYLRLTRQSG